MGIQYENRKLFYLGLDRSKLDVLFREQNIKMTFVMEHPHPAQHI